jgi:hypothetical protein
MKLLSRALIAFLITLPLITNITHARDVILIENLSTEDSGTLLLKILEEKFNIPKQLIAYRRQLTCSKNSEAIIQLCMRADGELDIIKMDKFIVQNSLSVFFDKGERQ